MKAIQYTAYGESDVITLAEVDKPTPGDNDVLIQAIAFTINPFEIKIRRGIFQKEVPIQFPYIPGSDVAGIVEAVGKNVSRLKVGDEVFATTFGGTYAEYVVLNEGQVALKPINVKAAEAAALAIPLATAYTLLVQEAEIQPGEKILIHGAAGGVGSVLVQMAKILGAYVIGTATGAGIALAKSAGADEVIDYKLQDFTSLTGNLDIVADLVGGETQVKSFEVLKKGGKLLSLFSPPSEELAGKYGVTAKFFSSEPSSKKLEFGKKLVEDGRIKPQVAEKMKLADAAKAQDMISAGGVNGKIVLEIN